jgi:hypothetical protein
MGSLSLGEEAAFWQDTEAYALNIRNRFNRYVDADAELKAHRDFVEKRAFGFGERAFHWLWKLIVDEMPDSFYFLEIGVYRGQIPSLIRLLADRRGRRADIYGVTLLSDFAGDTGEFPPHPFCDYWADIEALHSHFGQSVPSLIVGDSTDADVHAKARCLAPFDVVYIDGCHEYKYVVSDLLFYPTLLRRGGYLVVDDCACDLQMPFGLFKGIEDVCQAVRTVIETDPKWKHVLTVVHNRVWRKM